MTDNLFVVFLVILVPVTVGLFLWYFFVRPSAEEKAKMAEGERRHRLWEEAASGIRTFAVVKKIGNISSTGSGMSAGKVYSIRTNLDMTLEIELPDGQSFELVEDSILSGGKFYFDPAYVAYVNKIGARIPVRVHPDEHEFVRIDEARLKQLVTGQETDSPTP